jgi:hypothetical protein
MFMTLGWSILETFWGSNVGPTLGNNIILLSRRGLQKVKGGKGKDFHAYDEFLQHECKAHFRGLFMHLTRCDTSEKLRGWAANHSGDDLLKLATDTLRYHASSAAVERDESGDELR